ncbi:MAG: hypothetical protein R3321_09355 [Nitrososphaeraceae archaeon]|nr:hypothetical protein [Nitrososphaeraceae archaeon]
MSFRTTPAISDLAEGIGAPVVQNESVDDDVTVTVAFAFDDTVLNDVNTKKILYDKDRSRINFNSLYINIL